MSSLDILKSIYKPYRYTLNNGVTIIESTSGKFVLKKQNKDLFSLFNYLDTRGFDSYPKIIKNYRNEENVFEFIDEAQIPRQQKLDDLSSVLSSLHNKTVYFKKTSIDSYKEIYDNIGSNISYLSNYYESLFLNCCKKVYSSPGEYLFLRNYYKFLRVFSFCKDELDNWLDIVKDIDKQRVAVVHNNLSLEHFIYSQDRKVLISWDNYKVDTPIIDLVKVYEKEYLDLDFSLFLENYLNNFNLLEHEKVLFFILISLPKYFEFNENELKNVQIVKENIAYIDITENLIRPYYSKEEE